MTPDTILKHNGDLVGRQVDDGFVLVSPTLGEVKVLNPVGAIVWQLVDGQRSLKLIEDQLTGHFEPISPEKIQGDLNQFVTDLLEKEMLTVVG